MKTIQQLHREWADRIVPTGAPQVQRQEMERAFYSGALTLFQHIMADVTPLPDDAAEQAMQTMQHELEDYFRLLGTIPGPHGTSRQ